MTAKGKKRLSRVSGPRKTPTGPTTRRRRVPSRLTPAQHRELIDLVQTGVEKFIMNRVTVDEFFTGIRAVVDRDKTYAHQLTRSVFARIVKEAIRKHDLGR